jgi:trehalose-6-phosphate synthase
MLVPAMLRRRAPGLSIGFFLHTPFPSSEVYRLLPAREEVLRGLLGADYVSFQVGDYARHFRSSCLRILGLDSEPDAIDVAGRRVGSASIRSGSTPKGSARSWGIRRPRGSSTSSRSSTQAAP